MWIIFGLYVIALVVGFIGDVHTRRGNLETAGRLLLLAWILWVAGLVVFLVKISS